MQLVQRSSSSGSFDPQNSFDLTVKGTPLQYEPNISEQLKGDLEADIKTGFDELSSLEITDRGCSTAGLETECHFIGADGRPYDDMEDVVEELKTTHSQPVTWEFAPHIAEGNSTVMEIKGAEFLAQLEEQVRFLPQVVQQALRRREEEAVACMAGTLPSYGVEEVERGRICSKHSRYRHLFDGLSYLATHHSFGMPGEQQFHRVTATGLSPSGNFEQTEITLAPDSITVNNPNYRRAVRAPQGELLRQELFGAMTSFQLHLAIPNPKEDYVCLHRSAQAIVAAFAGIAANSAFVADHFLLQNSRLVMLPHITHPHRYSVTNWLEEPLEQFQHHVGFNDPLVRPLINPAVGSKVKLENITSLQKLFTHSGTFWPHVRTVASVVDGNLDLRPEFRPVCTASTAIDNAAHAVCYYGVMAGLAKFLQQNYQLDIGGNITELDARLPYRKILENEVNVAAYGVRAMITWVDGVTMPLTDFYDSVLVPAMKIGFKSMSIDEMTAQRYRKVVDDRMHFQLGDGPRGISGSDIQVWLYNNHPDLRGDSEPEKLRKLSLLLADAAKQDTKQRPQPILDWFVKNHLIA